VELDLDLEELTRHLTLGLGKVMPLQSYPNIKYLDNWISWSQALDRVLHSE